MRRRGETPLSMWVRLSTERVLGIEIPESIINEEAAAECSALALQHNDQATGTLGIWLRVLLATRRYQRPKTQNEVMEAVAVLQNAVEWVYFALWQTPYLESSIAQFRAARDAMQYVAEEIARLMSASGGMKAAILKSLNEFRNYLTSSQYVPPDAAAPRAAAPPAGAKAPPTPRAASPEPRPSPPPAREKKSPIAISADNEPAPAPPAAPPAAPPPDASETSAANPPEAPEAPKASPPQSGAEGLAAGILAARQKMERARMEREQKRAQEITEGADATESEGKTSGAPEGMAAVLSSALDQILASQDDGATDNEEDDGEGWDDAEEEQNDPAVTALLKLEGAEEQMRGADKMWESAVVNVKMVVRATLFASAERLQGNAKEAAKLRSSTNQTLSVAAEAIKSAEKKEQWIEAMLAEAADMIGRAADSGAVRARLEAVQTRFRVAKQLWRTVVIEGPLSMEGEENPRGAMVKYVQASEREDQEAYQARKERFEVWEGFQGDRDKEAARESQKKAEARGQERAVRREEEARMREEEARERRRLAAVYVLGLSPDDAVTIEQRINQVKDKRPSMMGAAKKKREGWEALFREEQWVREQGLGGLRVFVQQ